MAQQQLKIDDEWKNFLQQTYNNRNNTNNNNRIGHNHHLHYVPPTDEHANANTNIEQQNGNGDNTDMDTNTQPPQPDTPLPPAPICDDLIISTKTKKLFLNIDTLDIERIFWSIPILPYWKPETGIVKKEMRFVIFEEELFQQYEAHRDQYIKDHPELDGKIREQSIRTINNPNARKDKKKYSIVRKLTVGICKKDILNKKKKEEKKAMYNCIMLFYRFQYINNKGTVIYHEIHIKIFNTGNIEIPGVLNEDMLNKIKELIINTVQPFVGALETPLILYNGNSKNAHTTNAPAHTNATAPAQLQPTPTQAPIPMPMPAPDDEQEDVLINSTFYSGYKIDREKAFKILRDKYKLDVSLDTCTYQGVKCRFYFHLKTGFHEDLQTGNIFAEDKHLNLTELDELVKITKKYAKITFMLFQTGKGLIVGSFSEKVLMFVFRFVRGMLEREYRNIASINQIPTVRKKSLRKRKHIVDIDKKYYEEVVVA